MGNPLPDTTWNIQCTVCGGVTGFRQALLRVEGEVAAFSLDAARAEADRLNVHMNRHPDYSPSGRPNARFSYIPVRARP